MRLAVVAVLAVLALVVSSACSDAHTEEDKYRTDTGTDPAVVRVYVTKELAPLLEELVDAYSKQHRGISFVMVTQTTAASVKRVKEGGHPDLWVDTDTAVFAEQTKDPKNGYVATTVATDQMLLLVQEGNPDNITDVSVFGAEQDPNSALCYESIPCGRAAFAIIRAQGVEPKPDFNIPGPKNELSALTANKVGAGMLYRSQAVSALDSLTIIDLPDPHAEEIEYQFLRMTTNPSAAEFTTWVQQSPQSQEVLEPLGLTNGGSPS